MMLATDKQIDYLCSLAKKVEKIKVVNGKKKVIMAKLPDYIDWNVERHFGVTTKDASLRITTYREIIRNCNYTFYLCGIPQI